MIIFLLFLVLNHRNWCAKIAGIGVLKRELCGMECVNLNNDVKKVSVKFSMLWLDSKTGGKFLIKIVWVTARHFRFWQGSFVWK